MKEVVIAVEIFVIGVGGCLAATTESIMQLVSLTKFAPPCYINVTAATMGAAISAIENIE